MTNEADTAGSNHILKHEVGRYAINNDGLDGIAQLEHDIVGIGMGTSSILSGRQYVGRQSERLVDKLRRVKDGYNGLEDTAKKGGSNSA